MQNKIIDFGKIIFFVLFLFLTSCMSNVVHTGGIGDRLSWYDPRLDSPSPIYGGTVKDFMEMGRQIASPITSSSKNSIYWYEIFYLPVTIIDTPFSFISDTIYLPSDINFWSKWNDREKLKEEYFAEVKRQRKEYLKPIPKGKEKEYGVWEEPVSNINKNNKNSL